MTDVPKAITESLNTAEQNMLKKMAGNADFSGTTFVCVLIRGNELWSGNVGDSRCTAGESAGIAQRLVKPPPLALRHTHTQRSTLLSLPHPLCSPLPPFSLVVSL